MNIFAGSLILIVLLQAPSDQTWPMHVIDASSRGADGVRLGDLNGDGLQDIVTGWEQGGIVRVYLNPGPQKSTASWPAVTVGSAPNVEDAVFVDLDHDGLLDVVSSCEGNTKKHFVHWAPAKADLMDASKWKTETIPATANLTRWMFCLPMNVDQQHGVDLVVGSKEPKGQVGWLKSPSNPRKLEQWEYKPIQTAGWVMSLRKFDIDRDGDEDILISDRKGARKGIFWLENESRRPPSKWNRKPISKRPFEFMFLDVWHDDTANRTRVVSATRNGTLTLYSRATDHRGWETIDIPNPNEIPNGKAVAVGDINLDGRMDLVHTTNTGETKRPGVAVLLSSQPPHADAAGQRFGTSWTVQTISTSDGIKYDRIELLDLDGDGDLDVLTCEERRNLGVVWFENPTR